MKRFLLLALAVLAAGACATIRVAVDAEVDVPADFMGIIAGRGLIPDEYIILDELGVSWVRQGFFWHTVQPRAGEWDFTRSDTFVKLAKQAGKRILAVLNYDTPWLHANNQRNFHIPPHKLDSFLEYVERLVRRYGHIVDAWQIWNEPNNRIFWKGPEEDFFLLAQRTAERIKAVNPAAFVVSGSFSLAPLDYFRRMFEFGAFEHVDALSFHPYWLDPGGSLASIERMQAQARALGFAGEIWITEMGFPTGGWYPTRTTYQGQAEYLVQMVAGAAVRGVRTIFWYELYEHQNRGEVIDANNSERYFGIAYRDGEPKPAFYAYALMARLVQGSRYRPGLVRIPDALAGRIEALPFASPRGETALILWTRGRDPLGIELDLAPGASLRRMSVTGPEIEELATPARIEIGPGVQVLVGAFPYEAGARSRAPAFTLRPAGR